ncbi:MAG: redoxin domain-containing protein [Candidatus Aminicenantes bacterium]|nr:redoxin domain-containing protein [Candidatus Aminicenantes bacterium]
MKVKIVLALSLWLAFSAWGMFLPGSGEQASEQSQPPAKSEPVLRPALLGLPFPPLVLPSTQGDTIDLKNLKGKKVVLIVPRVYAGEGRWCTICNYQYAEAAAAASAFRTEHNAEILFLFPFDRDVVSEFLSLTPSQLEKIRGWKNPAEPEKLDEQGRQRLERMRSLFPKDLSMKEGEVPTPFPLLLDPERRISKTLGVFASEWGGSKGDQGVPAVFILDGEGILRFKYISQSTADRPDLAYLGWILKNI